METNQNLQSKKLELIHWLSSIEDPTLVEKIFEIKNEACPDWWNSISDLEKKTLGLGILDAEKGNMVPHDQVKSIYEKWL